MVKIDLNGTYYYYHNEKLHRELFFAVYSENNFYKDNQFWFKGKHINVDSFEEFRNQLKLESLKNVVNNF